MAGFFDNVMNKLNSGIDSVATTSKTMVEKSRLNSEIKRLENEKKQGLEAVGMQLYAFMSNTTEGDFPRDEALNLCAVIAEKDKVIEDCKAQISALEETAAASGTTSQVPTGPVCSCGFVNAPGACFCAKCGSKFE